MKKIITLFSSLVLALLIASCADSLEPTAPVSSSVVPGLDYRNSKAEVVVLNFFDMYCIHCQRDAKHVNEIYDRIQQGANRSDVAFYGIGWGNSPMEVEMYRKRYNVKYPLISDKNKAISKRFGKVRTPLIVVLKKENGQLKESFRISRIKHKKDEFCLKVGGFCVPVTKEALDKAGADLAN